MATTRMKLFWLSASSGTRTIRTFAIAQNRAMAIEIGCDVSGISSGFFSCRLIMSLKGSHEAGPASDEMLAQIGAIFLPWIGFGLRDRAVIIDGVQYLPEFFDSKHASLI